MEDITTRAAIEHHWRAAATGDVEAEHEIYASDVVMDYPQSGERICGRDAIKGLRDHHRAPVDLAVRRIVGSGPLWVTEYTIFHHGAPTNSVSIMEFADGAVARETQYFAEHHETPAWRAQWVDAIDAVAQG